MAVSTVGLSHVTLLARAPTRRLLSMCRLFRLCSLCRLALASARALQLPSDVGVGVRMHVEGTSQCVVKARTCRALPAPTHVSRCVVSTTPLPTLLITTLAAPARCRRRRVTRKRRTPPRSSCA
eukprot:4660759-Pleurochrysis_carterae.AAC.4